MKSQFFSACLLAAFGALSFGMTSGAIAQVGKTTPVVDIENLTEGVIPSANITEVVGGVQGFSNLDAALEAADLDEPLTGEGPFTVIAPSNQAFATLPEELLNYLLLPENQDLLAEVLTYHVIPGEIMYEDLEPGMVETLGGEELAVTIEEGVALVDDIPITARNVPATNGVIHVIEAGVLAPDTAIAELESRIQADLEAQAEAVRTEEETVVEETVVGESVVEETVVGEETAPAEPIRGLW